MPNVKQDRDIAIFSRFKEYNAMGEKEQDYFDGGKIKLIRMLQALTEEYANIFLWDIQKGIIEQFRNDGSMIGIEGQVKREISYEELIEEYITNYVFEDDRETMRQATMQDKIKKSLEDTGIFVYRYRVQSPDMDKPQYYMMKCVRPGWDRQLNAVTMGFSNIHQMMQKELEQREALENALALAEQASKAKSAFLTNMSHDIRTPMNAIIGYTALATSHIHNKNQVLDYLKKITASSNHLLFLINDVLDMSRIENGTVSLSEELCSLPDIMHDIKNIFQSSVHAKRMNFFIDTVDVVHENIFCDKLRLNQILLNCLGNAFKFTEPGGTISIRIIERAGAPKGYAYFQFRIKDTGIGMSKAFAEHIFEPFSRERTSTISGIPGTGLGMPIAKNIVDMMNGSIQVESEEGIGTEFIIDLVLKVSDQQPVMEPVKELAGLRALAVDEDSVSEACLENCSVLLVEDNELNSEIAATMLTDYGMKVDTAQNGKIAIEHLIEAPSAFDMVLMDIQMPVMDGYETTERIRAMEDPRLSSIPIIAMTANAFEEDRKKALECGMNEHIVKPIDKEQLVKIIHTYLYNT